MTWFYGILFISFTLFIKSVWSHLFSRYIPLRPQSLNSVLLYVLRTIRDGEPRTVISTFTHLLSSVLSVKEADLYKEAGRLTEMVSRFGLAVRR